ncbi:uncharacterized protein [Palaemon carinicauda]|uniref:uncharacterized protein n=1 Tax=Palaemon carinicauda TaxID=392227 RepID=UPI0035B5D7B3
MKRSTALRPCPSTPVPFLPTINAARFFSARARALFWIWVAVLIIGACGGDNSVNKGEKEWGDMVGGEDLVSLAELENPLPPPTTPPLPAHVTPASLQCEDLCGHEETASESAIRGPEPLALKVWCRNHHLRITSLYDVFPQCIPNNTKILISLQVISKKDRIELDVADFGLKSLSAGRRMKLITSIAAFWRCAKTQNYVSGHFPDIARLLRNCNCNAMYSMYCIAQKGGITPCGIAFSNANCGWNWI